MFDCDEARRFAWHAEMERLKAESRELRKQNQERILRRWQQYISENDLASQLRQRMRTEQGAVRISYAQTASGQTPQNDWEPMPPADYFSRERVAVYTCVLGGYDNVAEPGCRPDNVDYFIITDQEVPAGSAWQKLDVTNFLPELDGLDAVEQNRWFKTHPCRVFPGHNCSVYLDGNIRPVTDLTEFVNSIGQCGLATHRHFCRRCVYEEAKAVLQRGKDTQERIAAHVAWLRSQGMPERYGLLDGSVLARRHHEMLCIRLMEEWWSEFMAHSRRDQLSLPWVLYKNGISAECVAILGSNRALNDAIQVSQRNSEVSYDA